MKLSWKFKPFKELDGNNIEPTIASVSTFTFGILYFIFLPAETIHSFTRWLDDTNNFLAKKVLTNRKIKNEEREMFYSKCEDLLIEHGNKYLLFLNKLYLLQRLSLWVIGFALIIFLPQIRIFFGL